jgi:hypothetical protein
MKTDRRARFFIAIVLFLASFIFDAIPAKAQPTITQQPTNTSVLLGGTANLSVTATGTPPISFLWQFEGTNTTNSGQSLSIPIVHRADLGTYDVIISDQTGSVTSDVVHLTLAGPRPIITLVTNTPLYNVISLQYTVAPNVEFQLLVAHDMTAPVEWFGPAQISLSGDATNDNWSFDDATNYTEFYPETYWMLVAYP